MLLTRKFALKLVSELKSSTSHAIFSDWFRSYGSLVGRHPLPFLLATIVLNCVLSSGLYKIREETDAKKVYVPTNANSLREYEILEESKKAKEIYYQFTALIEAKNDGDLLNNRTFSEILEIADFVQDDLNITYNGSLYFYNDLYRGSSANRNADVSGNSLVKLIKRLTTEQKFRYNNSNINLKFPLIRAYGRKIFAPIVIMKVKTDDSGVIESAGLIRLYYKLAQNTKKPRFAEEQFLEICHQFAFKFESELQNMNGEDKNFVINTFHPQRLGSEMAKVTHKTFPMLLISMAMLMCFTISVGVTYSSCVTTKAWESLAGVISALMAVTSAFGLLFHLGYPFMGTVTTVPFLILAIGVDDMYLVLDAWKRTNSKLSSAQRLGLTMEEAGVSMTFAAVTDMISFGLGVISNIPAVSLFCLFTTVAVAFDFGYQLTFYLSIVSLSGARESQGFNSCCCCFKAKTIDKSASQIAQRSTENDYNSAVSNYKSYFQTKGIAGLFADLLNSPFGKLTMITSFCVYLVIALLGCCAIRARISPSKFVLYSSPYKHYWYLGEQYYFGQGFLVEILVSNPPDLRDKTGMGQLFAAIEDLESIKYSAGKDSTVFWLRDFIEYIDKVVTDDPYAVLNEWLNVAAFGGWRAQLTTVEVNRTIQKISDTQFVTGYKGVTDWNSKLELLSSLRNVSAKYPQLNITAYHHDFMFIDLFGALPDSIAQDAGIGILVLSVVTFMFFPNPLAIYWVTYFMISIMIGVLGYLSWWGADLDPVTVISYTISIGFSVDFTCHVASHYLTSTEKNVAKRLESTIRDMGWTTVKCAISTILGVAALLFVDAYVIQAFVWTVVIVVLVGVYHSLAILPTVFACLM